mmetsp:Transcript_19227/g.53578  ORF Transcript_19227/g.53578 Transcript_19227/m.53578 type:complete len:203 (+) Transcript_19227:1028-1636(+)
MIFPPAGSLGGTATSALSGSSSSNGSSNGSGSIGFSFSPGGLLLPYHMGVAECLVHEKFLDPSETMVAGSSAGSIASMAIGCGIDPRAGLEGTIAISDRCLETGKSARGNLLPLLQDQLQSLVGDAEFDFLQQRRTNNRNRRGSGSTEEDDDDDDDDAEPIPIPRRSPTNSTAVVAPTAIPTMAKKIMTAHRSSRFVIIPVF